MSTRQGIPLRMQSTLYHFAWEDGQHRTDGWEYAINVFGCALSDLGFGAVGGLEAVVIHGYMA